VRTGLFLLLLLQQKAPSALEHLAVDVAAQARAAEGRGPLAVVVAAPGRPALQQAFATLLLARLSGLGLAPVLLSPSGDAEAQARTRGMRALLRVRLSVDTNLSAAGDVLSTWVNVFSGRTGGRPSAPAALVFSEVPLDAAAQALARRPEPPGLLLLAEPLARYGVRTAALACGDLDGDGRAEVAVLTEEAVEVRTSDGRLLARRSLEALPRASVPSREAFGTLAVCDGLLYAFSARHAAGEVLALSAGALVPRAPLSRPVAACGRLPLEATFPPGAARLAPWGTLWPASPEGPVAWGLVTRPGPRGPVWLYLLEDGTARVQVEAGSWHSLPGVGAGAALADTQGDGALGLAASSADAAPAEDTLRLLGLSDGAERGRVQVPGRILQVAAAAFEALGPDALVLGVWRPDGGAELRVVRSLP
jgi:hypothetical protein